MVAPVIQGDNAAREFTANYSERLAFHDSSNMIVFAVRNEHFYPQWSRLMSKAQTLGKRCRLDLPWVVKTCGCVK
jgi:hypothetical protein